MESDIKDSYSIRGCVDVTSVVEVFELSYTIKSDGKYKVKTVNWVKTGGP